MKTNNFFLVALLFLTACAVTPKKPIKEPALTKEFELQKTSFLNLQNWKKDQTAKALKAFAKSCESFSKMPADRNLEGNKISLTAGDFHPACLAIPDTTRITDQEAQQFFEYWFDPYLVKSFGEAEGFFTGYYESELLGSWYPSKDFKAPLFSKPKDLISGQPYLTREQIESGALKNKADILLWLPDPVDAFFLHIQGSGRVKMTDGQIVRVGYAGNNGYDFVPMSQIMKKEGIEPLGGISAQSIRSWLKGHPKEGRQLMNQNPRYIFFTIVEKDNGGPIGSQGVPLTPMRSLAVDKTLFPLGLPFWLETQDPDQENLHRLMIAQDTGSAITGPIRGDFFWGFGEEALHKAGRMKSKGRYFILLPKNKT